MHREDHNTKLSTNVRPSFHLLVHSHPLFEFISPFNRSLSILLFLLLLYLINPLLASSLFLSSIFSLSSRLKCWHNISATCIMASRGHRNIERTFLGPHVCASACPSTSSSSSCSPTVAQMRLGCTDSADFLSDGCKKRTRHFKE